MTLTGLRVIAVAALICAPSIGASAGEVTLGLGYTGFSGDEAQDSRFGSLEYHHTPFASWAGFDIGLGAEVIWDGNDDKFIGAGLVATRDFGDSGWFLQLSEMPGYYDAGIRSNDLGHDVEFHSQLALGYRLSPESAVSLAVSHMSNANLGDENPGANFLQLRLHRSFGHAGSGGR